MRDILCKHCGNKVQAEDTTCVSCGIPLPPDHGKTSPTRFIVFFIALCLFCGVMMWWLPPNWTGMLSN